MKLKYVRACPSCRSRNVVLYAGGITGSYECKDCGYVGAVVEVAERISKRKKKVTRNG